MQLTVVVASLLAAVVSARDFTLYDDANFGGATHFENRWDDDACWNMNGAGDRASSVRGAGCTTFFRERDCKGSNWQNYGDAATVPDFLNDHIWSFRNKCYGPTGPCGFNEIGLGFSQICQPTSAPGVPVDGGCGAETGVVFKSSCGGDLHANTPMRDGICNGGWTNNWRVYCENDKPIWASDGLRTYAQCRQHTDRCERVLLAGKAIKQIDWCCRLQ